MVMRSIGLALFQRYFTNPALYQSFYNSLFVSVVSTTIATTLAFAYAFCLTRTAMPFKMAFRVLAMVPIFAPTMVYGLSLIYLFGNQGLITTGFNGALPWLAWDINLYGPVGIIIAEVVFTFPPALVILLVAFANTDARLYEAAASLGASGLRTFFTVTLPGVRYGLINAAFVCFTLAFTDFGAPTIVGGNYNVLAVDIYKQVVGQMNYGMAATVSMVLLIPAVAAFIVQRIVQRRVVAQLSARSVPYVPKPNRRTDAIALAVCGLIALAILAIVFTAGFAALFVRWPYDLSLTFTHFLFEGANGSYSDFWNSVRMACYTAAAGTFLTFGSAYLVEKSKGMRLLRQSAYVMSVIPLALPGMVVGIAYIFFFNAPSFAVPFTEWSLPNPLSGLYGTMAILVLCNVVHFYTVSYLTATTALRQLDSEFESVSESLAVPFYKTFFRVTAPVSLPAIFEIAAFFFVNGMATVSGVIFLYTADTRLASVAVVDMANEGNNAAAAAMCMLIVLTNLLVRGLIELANWGFAKRTAKWRRR
jgi:iron(III) transport system permease protein